MILRLSTLLPIASIASGRGPIQARSASVVARAKPALSAKNPYPGCTASAPERLATSINFSTFR